MTKATLIEDRKITFRMPRTESVELTVNANDKPVLGEISNGTDRPFEISRLTVKLTALADGAIPDQQPLILDRLILEK